MIGERGAGVEGVCGILRGELVGGDGKSLVGRRGGVEAVGGRKGVGCSLCV